MQTRTLLIIALVVTLVHLFIAMNTPLVLMTWQIYDDGLFVRLAQYLAKGQWLGPFNQFTLMKGPGYPLFLAFNYWVGLPITLTRALLFCAAVASVSFVVFKMTGSRVLAMFVYVAPMLDPKTFEITRILRDSIYVSQTVLVLAVFSYSLFIARSSRVRFWSAIAGGLLLGWFWLTREEGIWLVPGLVTLVLYAILRKRSQPAANSWLLPTLCVIGVFLLTQLAFAVVNLRYYGSFSGVDFKERNFQAAWHILESVQPSKRTAYVSVPREVRMKAYAVSPSFASLKPYIDPESGSSRWEAGECKMHSSACGDIGTGFFIWAMRDAVAAVGQYNSPKAASNFYARMTAEIQAACNDGRLHCVKKLIPEVPSMTREQLWSIPVSAGTLFRDVMHPGADTAPDELNVFGPENEFQSTVDFLNHPAHYPLSNTLVTHVEMRGWYYLPGSEGGWFTVKVLDEQGKDVPYTLVRSDSPDLPQSFHDERASRQRFSLSATCAAKCTIIFTGADAAPKSFPIIPPVSIQGQISKVGTGLLALDAEDVWRTNSVYDDVRVKLARRIRQRLYSVYTWMQPPLLVLGLLSFVLACFLAIRQRQYPVIIGIAATCWVSSLMRALILILVNASSFTVMDSSYMAPIFILTVIASVLSIYALFALVSVRQMVGGRVEFVR
ncbi:hypothetical protein ACFFJT_20115 [Dyella flava]|uniref:Dolichyl-phosphate-mannose-protein mannosyltransferase n=1 Tax=Dyella flava TaxID=1920170 RepID=A0ABS2K1W0_9GAMM|nr:hypothetical protein [Dyella flava]MBM7124615.1 hypothetical protein [Dyella flava]GLQ49268.1 hypothetical protein GCM10010872_07170 [Dyella flava]